MYDKQVEYREGYKYQVASDFLTPTQITGFTVEDQFYTLFENGDLLIKSGYASDGPSGPTIDTPDFMRGAFVHDALYEMMRKEQIPQSRRDEADNILREICIEDGMPEFRADYVHAAVCWFAERSADPENKREVITAP